MLEIQKQNANGLWKVGVSLAILALLTWRIDPARLVGQLHLVTLPVLGVMVLGVVLGQVVNILSQYWAVRPIKKISLAKILPYSIASWVSELFLPGKLGVFSLAYFFQKEGVRVGESMAVILILRLFNMGFALLLAFIGIGKFLDVPGAWSAFAGVLVLFIGIYFFFFTAAGRVLFREKILGKYAVYFAGFSAGLNKIKGNYPALAGLIFLSGAYVLVQGGITYLYFAMSGYPLNLLTVMSTIALVQIAVQIPITINGWGVRESMMVVFFSQMGVPGEVILILSMVSISMAYIIALPLSWTVIREIPPKLEWFKGNA